MILNGKVIDVDAFINAVEHVQQQAKLKQLDLKKDLSLISDDLANALSVVVELTLFDGKFKHIPDVVRDDCRSQGLLYMLKYGIKNFDARRSHRHVIPYFKRIAQSAFYRVLQNHKRHQEFIKSLGGEINGRTDTDDTDD